MANQDSPLWERLGMDYDLSPPWTLTENALSDTFKAPCCCFENAPYTELTIV